MKNSLIVNDFDIFFAGICCVKHVLNKESDIFKKIIINFQISPSGDRIQAANGSNVPTNEAILSHLMASVK